MKVMFVCRGAEYIGVEYLSAILRAQGHATDLIFDPGFDDTFFFRMPFLKRLNRWPYLLGRVKGFKPDVLAVSSISNTYPYIRELLAEIKKAYRCYAVIGGVHAPAIPEYVVRDGLFAAVNIFLLNGIISYLKKSILIHRRKYLPISFLNERKGTIFVLKIYPYQK